MEDNVKHNTIEMDKVVTALFLALIANNGNPQKT